MPLLNRIVIALAALATPTSLLAGAPVAAAAPPTSGVQAATSGVVPTSTTAIPLGPGPSAAARRVAGTSSLTALGDSPTLATGVVEVAPFTLAAVTWADPTVLPGEVSVRLRLREDGTWSEWQSLDSGEIADPAATTAIDGTEPLVTDGADAVQVELDTPDDVLPAGLNLVLVDGGRTPVARQSLASLSTATATAPTAGTGTTTTASDARPTIITRSQWGADESLRSGTVSTTSQVVAVTVHHTASTNNYSATDAAAQVRAVYAYHTRSLGWSDIGYNFLVDKFGRVYEGRAGSITRAVTGAHAGGFNTSTMGISALGNYDTAAAPDALVRAVGEVAGWKLSQYGFDPATETTLTSTGGGTSRYAAGARVRLPRVFAHRQVGSTACPGAYLYARMATVRSVAVATAAAAAAPTPAPPPAPTPVPAPAPTPTAPGQVLGAGAVPVAGDLDGNGRDEMGWFRDGRWALRTYSGSVVRFSFGTAGDVPVLGDWDGDGKDEPGVFRGGRWFWRDSASTGPAVHVFAFGTAGDVPRVGRWGGQQQDGIAVVRGNTWHTRWSVTTGPAQHVFRFGGLTDTPVLGSWLPDRVARPGVVRAGTWHLSTSVVRPVAVEVMGFGRPTDAFLPVDWDGDGIQQPVAVRGDTFYVRRSIDDPSAVAITFGG